MSNKDKIPFYRGGVDMSELTINQCVNDMQIYIAQLRKEVTKKKAVDNLIKIGVLEEDGKTITEHQRIEDK